MARSKRQHEDSDEEVEEFTDSGQSNAAEDDSIGEEPTVEENTNGGAPSDSPSRSVSESDREGTPPSPSLSGFAIEPIRMLARAAAGEESPVKPKKSPAKSGSKRTASTTADDGEVGGAPKARKKKKSSSSSSAAATVAPTHAAARGDEEKMKSTGAIQRLWSDEDEIAILEGMYEFRAKTGSFPNSDSGAFFDFIKDSFHVEVSKNQLMDKIRRLKKKFRVNAEKSERGENPIFAKPHDSKAFKLSKKIWGKSEADEEIQIENNSNANGMKKKAKQCKSDKSAPDVVPENGSVVPENSSEKPVTLGLPKQDVSRKKHKKKPNAEPKPGCDEPAKGNLECEAAAGVESKSIPEVIGDRIDEVVEKENGEKKIDGDDEFSARYPYLFDVVETMLSQRVLGDIPKSLLVEKVRDFGGDEAKEWDDKWKALRSEEMQLHTRMLEFKAELSKKALASKK